MKVTKRQLKLLIKEARGDRMSRGELNEIGAVLAAMGKAVTKVGPALAKGTKSVGKAVAKNPKLGKAVSGLMKQAKDNLPKVAKHLADEGFDLENPDLEKLAQLLMSPPEELEGELDMVMQQGAKEAEKAAACDCPTEKELEQVSEKRVIKRRLRRLVAEMLEADHPSEVEAVEDVWSGDPDGKARNLELDLDHPKVAGGEETTKEPEMLPRPEDLVSERRLRRLVRKIVAGSND